MSEKGILIKQTAARKFSTILKPVPKVAFAARPSAQHPVVLDRALSYTFVLFYAHEVYP